MVQNIKFNFIEYSSLLLMLALSAFIGVYFGFIKKAGQNTVKGYMLGGKEMSLFPISMSLISSFICGIFLLGMPAEIYSFGINYALMLLSYPLVGLFCAYVLLPVFYKLQLVSIYEYMELRFNKLVREMVSLLFTMSVLIYTPSVIYGPAMALNQVSGFGTNTISIFLSVICIFYTAFGGLKAVVWTDTLQAFVIYAAVIVISVIGTLKVGGIWSVIGNNNDGSRLDFNWDLDPKERATVWTVAFGFIINNGASCAFHPSFMQRFISLNTIQKAKLSAIYFMLGTTLIGLINIYMGLVIYSHYKDCDPLSTGVIQKSDEIATYFVVDVMRDFPGLPGVFMAGLISAGLSTVSAGLNTVAGTTYKDFVEPVTGKLSDAKAANIMKGLVVGFGVVCLLLVVFVMEKLGSLVELYNSFAGPSAGTVFGIFILGLFFPHVNSMGAFVGSLFSLTSMSWIIYNAKIAKANGDIVYASLPMSVENCPYNFTMPPNNMLTPTPVSGKVFPLYEISVFYYTTLACIIAMATANIVSLFTANKLSDVNRDLLSPLIHRFLPDYTAVPLNESELKTL